MTVLTEGQETSREPERVEVSSSSSCFPCCGPQHDGSVFTAEKTKGQNNNGILVRILPPRHPPPTQALASAIVNGKKSWIVG